MPEYLTPGVYLEETSFRARSIEGVPTSTFGMAGLCRYGPVPYVMPRTGGDVVMAPGPTPLGSFTEFERAFGGLKGVGTAEDTTNYLAHAARAFYDNGGRRLYVARVFPWIRTNGSIDFTKNFATVPSGPNATWRARWPGAAGNEISVRVGFVRSKNVVSAASGAAGGTAGRQLKGVAPGAAVELGTGADPTKPPPDTTTPAPAQVRIVMRNPQGDRELGFRGAAGAFVPLGAVTGAFHLTLTVSVRMGSDRLDTYTGLELDDAHPRSVARVLRPVDPVDEFGLVWLEMPAQATPALLGELLALKDWTFLRGGSDGNGATAALIKGEKADPDDADDAATGLAALGEVDDVAIVATPDSARFGADERKLAVDNLIGHCEELRYRIAVVDPPQNSSISGVRAFRAQFDSTHAALYHPWVEVLDPTARPDPGAPPPVLALPPSGFVAGIYARTDVTRGVHKAPANEVVRGIIRFQQNVTYERQAFLNPEGINALRFFEGRSNRVWGARTMSSDPEWKYVNVRRLFAYLEHSIEKSTQWAVFEPNNQRLWASVRRTIEDFLLVTWRTGALMGNRPEEAYFVRCDRSTMTQNDLDNGRLICLIGVSPTYPAEFVIFRIGQWTADAPQS